MSWFKKALSITTMYPDSYYTAVDPGEFYEWKFLGEIPEGKIFTKGLPASDVFTDGMLIATARIPDEYLDKHSFGFKTNSPVKSDIFVQAGQIQSPKELIEKYFRMTKEFNHSVDQFRKAATVRPYFSSDDKLYRIVSQNESVKLINYGPVKDLMKKLNSVRSTLTLDALRKHGRAHELEMFRRFENAMTFINNDRIPVDATKMDTILNIAHISPEQTRELDWKSCFLEVSPEGRSASTLLSRYESLNWIKAGTSIMPMLT